MEDIQPTLEYLEKNGIRGIINYAAEDDVSESEDAASQEAAMERACDRRLDTFMTSVRVQDNLRNTGFVAIKVRDLNLLQAMEVNKRRVILCLGFASTLHMSSVDIWNIKSHVLNDAFSSSSRMKCHYCLEAFLTSVWVQDNLRNTSFVAIKVPSVFGDHLCPGDVKNDVWTDAAVLVHPLWCVCAYQLVACHLLHEAGIHIACGAFVH